MRAGPLVAGKQRYWDIQKVAGGDIVYTCPPYVLEPLFEMGDDIDFRSEIEEDVPAGCLDKMLTLPYCIQAYDPNGLTWSSSIFILPRSPRSRPSAKGFSSLEAFVGERMVSPVVAMA